MIMLQNLKLKWHQSKAMVTWENITFSLLFNRWNGMHWTLILEERTHLMKMKWIHLHEPKRYVVETSP